MNEEKLNENDGTKNTAKDKIIPLKEILENKEDKTKQKIGREKEKE